MREEMEQAKTARVKKLVTREERRITGKVTNKDRYQRKIKVWEGGYITGNAMSRNLGTEKG